MSPSEGSLVFASRWAARRMNFCLFIASSKARIDFWRPTNNGTTMCGKTMISRSGSRGTRIPPPPAPGLSRLSFLNSMLIFPLAPLGRFRRLLIQNDRLLALRDDLFGNHDFFDRRLRRNFVHHVE